MHSNLQNTSVATETSKEISLRTSLYVEEVSFDSIAGCTNSQHTSDTSSTLPTSLPNSTQTQTKTLLIPSISFFLEPNRYSVTFSCTFRIAMLELIFNSFFQFTIPFNPCFFKCASFVATPRQRKKSRMLVRSSGGPFVSKHRVQAGGEQKSTSSNRGRLEKKRCRNLKVKTYIKAKHLTEITNEYNISSAGSPSASTSTARDYCYYRPISSHPQSREDSPTPFSPHPSQQNSTHTNCP